jgi:GrpB-like predicted nucleotidyltransferase (UPF0157 family)
MANSLSEMTREELWKLFPIILCKYNPAWANWYAEEEKRLNRIIGNPYIERINHIGSTSVPGLTAKPTIDIVLEITEDCDLNFLASVLEENGYIFEKQPQKPAPHIVHERLYHSWVCRKGISSSRSI